MVAARMERQAILARDKPPMLWVILDEGVLRRPVGGTWVMKDQLRRLADRARRAAVVLQVIPLSAGAHQGISGDFVLAEFDGAAPVVYQDTAARGQIIEDAAETEGVSLLWDTLLAEALPRSASLALVEEEEEEWERHGQERTAELAQVELQHRQRRRVHRGRRRPPAPSPSVTRRTRPARRWRSRPAAGRNSPAASRRSPETCR